MVGKTSFLNTSHLFFSSQFSRITPYLTPRVAIISLVALGTVAALAYALGKNRSLPPVTPPPSPQQPKETAYKSDASQKQGVEPFPAHSLTPLSPVIPHPHFKNNVRAIIDFPNDPFARISSFEDGILDRSDGICRPFERDGGTALFETVEIIKEVFFQASSLYEEALKAVKDKPRSEDQIRLLLPLSEALSQETALLEGVSRVQCVYRERKKRKDKAALKALNILYENRKAANQLHLHQYQSLIQTLQKSTPPLKTAEPSVQPEDASSLATFCQLYCPGISSDQAKNMIREGQCLLGEILRGERKPATELKESQEELAQITWFLTYCALEKEQCGGQWSFAIEEDSKLYEFLKTSPAAYQRMSNHYVGRSPDTDKNDGYVMKSSVHQGVDVHNGHMPAQKRTILFGLINTFDSEKQVLFFKPDNFGTRMPQDLLTYASTLFQKQSTDKMAGVQDEKVPDSVMNAFVDLTTYIRANFQDYESLIWALPYHFQSPKHTKENAKIWGIAYMYAFIKAIKNQESLPAEFDAEAAPLEATWASLDHPDKRTGREIYLTADELNKFISATL